MCTLGTGQVIESGMAGIWVADGMSRRKLEGKLLQASLLLEAPFCIEAGPGIAVVFEEAAAWRRTFCARFFCALEVAPGVFSAASS